MALLQTIIPTVTVSNTTAGPSSAYTVPGAPDVQSFVHVYLTNASALCQTSIVVEQSTDGGATWTPWHTYTCNFPSAPRHGGSMGSTTTIGVFGGQVFRASGSVTGTVTLKVTLDSTP